jgi:hypothetical protein
LVAAEIFNTKRPAGQVRISFDILPAVLQVQFLVQSWVQPQLVNARNQQPSGIIFGCGGAPLPFIEKEGKELNCYKIMIYILLCLFLCFKIFLKKFNIFLF